MAFYDTLWWCGLCDFGLFAWVGLIVVDVCRRGSVKGSHTRYTCTTLQWALTGPAALHWLTGLIEGAARTEGPILVLGCVVTILWSWATYRLYADRDDNWFKRTGKRLRRWASDRLTALTPMPQGAGA